ncbi:MAG TPA: hypothetical protein VEI83_09920 [Acidimicrobiales bacterium]|nr:hypothetical protein [Acidimicrobiales bacterium]
MRFEPAVDAANLLMADQVQLGCGHWQQRGDVATPSSRWCPICGRHAAVIGAWVPLPSGDDDPQH